MNKTKNCDYSGYLLDRVHNASVWWPYKIPAPWIIYVQQVWSRVTWALRNKFCILDWWIHVRFKSWDSSLVWVHGARGKKSIKACWDKKTKERHVFLLRYLAIVGKIHAAQIMWLARCISRSPSHLDWLMKSEQVWSNYWLSKEKKLTVMGLKTTCKHKLWWLQQDFWL